MNEQTQLYIEFLENNYLTLEERQARVKLEVEKTEEALKMYLEAQDILLKEEAKKIGEAFEKLLEDEDFYPLEEE